MRFQLQLMQHNPDLGSIGDCFRTSLACLLDIDPSRVPHFMELYPPDKDGYSTKECEKAIRDWLTEYHLSLFDIPFAYEGPPEALMLQIASLNGEDILYMLTGKSDYGNHTLVCRGAGILWDPSPSKIGLQSPINGNYWVSILVPLFLRYTP